MSKECHPLLRPLVPVVKLLGEMLSSDYEIALHDVSGKQPVLITYVHGQVTGRDKNSPMTNFGNFLIKNPDSAGVDYIANYLSEAPNGRRLRSGVALIRDDDKRLVGFLCINYDVTRASILKDLGDFLMKAEPLAFDGASTESFGGAKSAASLIQTVRRKFGKPLSFLTKEERMQCIRDLDGEGFFNFKSAVEGLAKEMGKSRYTLYADVRKVRGEKSDCR